MLTYHLRLFVAAGSGYHGLAHARLGVPAESVVLVKALLFAAKRFPERHPIPVRHDVVQYGIYCAAFVENVEISANGFSESEILVDLGFYLVE